MDKKNGPQKSYHQLGWLNWVCKDSYKLQRKHPRLDGVTEKQIPGKSGVHLPRPKPHYKCIGKNELEHISSDCTLQKLENTKI